MAKYIRQPSPYNTQIVALGVDTYLKMLLHDNFVVSFTVPPPTCAQSLSIVTTDCCFEESVDVSKHGYLQTAHPLLLKTCWMTIALEAQQLSIDCSTRICTRAISWYVCARAARRRPMRQRRRWTTSS